MITKESFIPKLLEWFSHNKRPLSFREDKDPYKIWISEIMAQQTQIETLMPYFDRFINRFPHINSLANAEEKEVLKYWEGLGYYSRARNIHKCAKLLESDFQSQFPNDEKNMIKLPGIGPYTCGAILSIAFNQPIPAVDGNVLRVITRIKHWDDDITLPQTKKKISTYLKEIMPETPGDFNESLMELGAIICTPKNPKCNECPVSQFCLSYYKMDWHRLPVKTKKTKQNHILMEIGLVTFENLYYIVKRPSFGLLANLWAFPSIETNSADGKSIQKFILKNFSNVNTGKKIGETRHVFTHRIWDISLYRFKLDNFPNDFTNSEQSVFVTLDEIKQSYPLPTAFSKLIQMIDE